MIVFMKKELYGLKKACQKHHDVQFINKSNQANMFCPLRILDDMIKSDFCKRLL